MATLNKYNLSYLNWPHSAFELQSTKAAIILVWISPFLREKAALVQVERLYPTACSLKYTSSEVNHTVILCYRYVLYPCSLSTKLAYWFCCTATEINVLLWIYMLWCFLGPLLPRVRLSYIFPMPRAVFMQRKHDITAYRCMEHKKNLLFDCDQRNCNRPCRNRSQVAPSVKRYPQFRYINSENDRGRDDDHIGIDSANQNFLSAILDYIVIMHKQ